MIDPEVRIQKIEEYAEDEQTGIILFDVVLGHGAHEDMVGSIATCHRKQHKQQP